MADEAKAPQTRDSLKTFQGLAIVLIVVLAVFMVTSLNQMNTELTKLNEQFDSLVTTTAQSSMAAYQAVDADGKVAFRFTMVPASVTGLGSEGCPASPDKMLGPSCSAGSAGGPCAAEKPASK